MKESSCASLFSLWLLGLCLLLVALPQCVIGGANHCTQDSECGGLTPFCRAGQCVPCQEDSDCGATRRCIQSAGVVRCVSAAINEPVNQSEPTQEPTQKGNEALIEAVEPISPNESRSEPSQEAPSLDAGPEPLPSEQPTETPPEPVPDPAECVTGQLQVCYTGPAGTAEKGACRKGTQVCDKGQWGPCTGSLTPKAETCDGIDNDCDGTVDNDIPEVGKDCQSQTKGECAPGKIQCTKGALVCTPNNKPIPEICDGKDNDCDGQVDEDFANLGKACVVGKGTCQRSGTLVCNVAKSGTDCNAVEGKPTTEICDGKDNDCDGQTDENNAGGGAACKTTQPGECQAGIRRCLKGALTCVATSTPTPEICDGKDNDCDGNIDDNIKSTVCYVLNQTICVKGTSKCVSGKTTCQNTNPFNCTSEGCGKCPNGASAYTCRVGFIPYCFKK